MYPNRYNDYYLVNDEDMDIEESIEFSSRQGKCRPKKVMWIILLIILILAILAFLLIFVGFPLALMNSLSLQQNLVFTHFGLPSELAFYKYFAFPGFKNHYVTVKDIDTKKELDLGLWHILPLDLAKISLKEDNYDYDGALKSSNYSVLLYFHGTGEDRSQSLLKYQFLRYFFHIITFDYRSYADSTKGDLYEKNVVNDCVQVYKWLQRRTESHIYVWGHSLGSALATETLAQLGKSSNASGLILEAPFTTFKDELYHHPYVKYFTWLPWFKATVVKPFERNGFIFDTSSHVLQVNCPIMFLHAEDDAIVPYFMSEKLYEIAEKRKVDEKIKNDTQLILIDKELQLNHYFVYRDPYVLFYVNDFMKRCSEDQYFYNNNGSHQS